MSGAVGCGELANRINCKRYGSFVSASYAGYSVADEGKWEVRREYIAKRILGLRLYVLKLVSLY